MRLRSAAPLAGGMLLAALLATPLAVAAQQAPGAPAAANDSAAVMLAAVKTATERYKDVKVALADGYVPDPSGMCITAPMEGRPAEWGAMGIHYFRPDLLGLIGDKPRVRGTGTHLDFQKPGVLLYEPGPDGRLTLVGVENVVFEEGWKAAGKTAPPSWLGNEFPYMVDDTTTADVDEAHGFQPHYELHVWLYRDNPRGMFEPFNPAVSCPAAPMKH